MFCRVVVEVEVVVVVSMNVCTTGNKARPCDQTNCYFLRQLDDAGWMDG